MRSEQEVKEFLKNSIDKTFEGDYFVESREQSTFDKIMESEDRHHQYFEEQANSAILFSMNSITGSLFEKVVAELAKYCGFEDITESDFFIKNDTGRVLNLEIPIAQYEKIMEIINSLISEIDHFKKYTNSQFFDTMIDEARNALTKTCLDISYKNDKNVANYECSFDFCMLSPEWMGKQFILVQELKYGGNLDVKKAKSERQALLKEFAFMTLLNAEKIRDGNIFVESRFGIIAEDKVQSGSVKKYFTSEEVKFGNEFWVSMCGYDLYKFSKRAMADFRKKESEMPETLEFMNNIKIVVEEKFNELGIPFRSRADELQKVKNDLYNSYKREILQKQVIENLQEVNNLLMTVITEDQLASI